MECIHTRCSREAVYQEIGTENAWCKECMEYALGFSKSLVCDKCNMVKKQEKESGGKE